MAASRDRPRRRKGLRTRVTINHVEGVVFRPATTATAGLKPTPSTRGLSNQLLILGALGIELSWPLQMEPCCILIRLRER
jgi:hypothetical protein